MKLYTTLLIVTLVFTACSEGPDTPVPAETHVTQDAEVLDLPEPRLSGDVPLELALHERRSVREYSGESLTLEEVGQLLWSAQGVTAGWGGRTAPSAGALYPLELYLVAGKVDGLASGVYLYQPLEHQLVMVMSGDIREELSVISLRQDSVRDGAAVFVFSGVYERTRSRYGDRGERYVHMEAGHAAQNLCLQATALRLGSVVVGAFNDDELADLFAMQPDEAPLYVVPVGRVTSGS